MTEPKPIQPERNSRAEVRLVPLGQPRTAEELEALRFRQAMLAEGAEADAHVVLGATHFVMRGEEVVGYVSLGGMPVLNIWLDSKRVVAHESREVLGQIDAMAADRGMTRLLCPCAANSPFQPVMERLGFERLGETVLFARRVPH